MVFTSKVHLDRVKRGHGDVVSLWAIGKTAQFALGGGDLSVGQINAATNLNQYPATADGQLKTVTDCATLTLKATQVDKAVAQAMTGRTVPFGG